VPDGAPFYFLWEIKMMNITAYGQNVTIRPIKQYEETWKGEVVLSPWKQKLQVGTIVFYPDFQVTEGEEGITQS